MEELRGGEQQEDEPVQGIEAAGDVSRSIARPCPACPLHAWSAVCISGRLNPPDLPPACRGRGPEHSEPQGPIGQTHLPCSLLQESGEDMDIEAA